MEQKEIQNLLQTIRTGGFDRIATAIETTWGDDACEKYLNRLTVDDRGNRQGFPAPVFSAIIKLSIEHNQKFGFSSNDIWTSVPAHKEKVEEKRWTSNRVVATPQARSLISRLIPLFWMVLAFLLWKVYSSL